MIIPHINNNQPQTLATITDNPLARIAQLATDPLTSPHSKRAYQRHLIDFLEWLDLEDRPPLTKATVNRYRSELLGHGRSSSVINQAMSAIRKLVNEAADNGLIPHEAAAAINLVKGKKRHGNRAGNWLRQEEAQRLINAPDTDKLKGLRDRAILAVMIGAGLRRSEVTSLTFTHIQKRDGLWAIVDMEGKHGRIRTIGIDDWVKAAVDQWAGAAGLSSGYVFRPLTKSGRTRGDRLTAQAIYNVVSEYNIPANVDIAPHDLRRSFAKISHKNGATLEQIQLSLGHSKIETTQVYVNADLDLEQSPSKMLGLSLE